MIICRKMLNNFERSITPYTDGMFHDSDPVEYECVAGYTIDDGGAATCEKLFEIICQADKSFIAHHMIDSVKCGAAAEVAFAEFDISKHFFLENVQYTYESCYTADGTAAGSTTFEASCRATIQWYPYLRARCLPRDPGTCERSVQHGSYSCFPTWRCGIRDLLHQWRWAALVERYRLQAR